MEKRTYGLLALIITTSIVIAWYFFTIRRSLSDQILTQTIDERFEEGLGEWVSDSDVPEDPNNPGHSVQWNVTRTTIIARSGQYSLEFFIDGSQDDGTIWIERNIDTRENTDISVIVSFELYSQTESFNTIADVCAYAGTKDPETEGDFAVLGSANQVAGWRSYNYTTTLHTGSSGEVWVALGITVRWETSMTYYIDDVHIEIAPSG